MPPTNGDNWRRDFSHTHPSTFSDITTRLARGFPGMLRAPPDMYIRLMRHFACFASYDHNRI